MHFQYYVEKNWAFPVLPYLKEEAFPPPPRSMTLVVGMFNCAWHDARAPVRMDFKNISAPQWTCITVSVQELSEVLLYISTEVKQIL